MQIAKAAADPEHLLSRSQHLQDLVPALVRLEQNRAAEDCVLVEQLGNVIDVPLFDGGAEAVGEHRHTPARVNVTCVTPLGEEVASIS